MEHPTDLLADDELLLQPGFEEGEIPPTYGANNLPDGEPVAAVPRLKPMFYGPLSGPFAVQVPGDTLQTPEDWVGYIRVNPDGGLAPVSEQNFNRVYEILGEVPGGLTPADENTLIGELTAENARLIGEIQELQDRLVAAVGIEPIPSPDDDEVLLQPEDDDESEERDDGKLDQLPPEIADELAEAVEDGRPDPELDEHLEAEVENDQGDVT